MSSVYIYIEGNGTPLQYVCLQNPMDRGAWWAAVHGVTKSWTWLSDFPFTFHFHALEKEMATHSSDLAWRIPGTEEPGGPLSMGSHRVGHNWSDLAAAYTYIHTYIHTYIYIRTQCSQFVLSSPIYSKSILLEGLSAPGMITDCCDFLSLIQTWMSLSSSFVFSYSFQWRFFCMLWEQKGILSILLRKRWLYISSLN